MRAMVKLASIGYADISDTKFAVIDGLPLLFNSEDYGEQIWMSILR